MPLCDYCAVVSRVEERPRAGIWPIHLRERLPIFARAAREMVALGVPLMVCHALGRMADAPFVAMATQIVALQDPGHSGRAHQREEFTTMGAGTGTGATVMADERGAVA